MGNLENLSKEQAFLNSMVDLTNYKVSSNNSRGNYFPGGKKYSCDPCDACGPDACADCNGCAMND